MPFEEFELAEQMLAQLEANEDIESIFRNEGVAVEVRGNQPLLLNTETDVWMVTAGMLDIFSAPFADGAPVGARSHLLRLNPGRICFGIATASEQSSRGLLAVGELETKALRLPLARLQQVAKEQEFSAIGISALLDEWIATLLLGFRIGLIPQNCQDVPPYEEVRFAQPTAYKARRRVNWIRHIEGASCLMNLDFLPPLPSETYFPVSEKTWLYTQANAIITSAATLDVIARPDFWDSVQQFHRFVLESMSIIEQRKIVTERERLEQKADDEAVSLQHAFLNLAAVVKPEKADVLTDTRDPLLAVCQTIGKYLNLAFVTYPGSKQSTLNEIARASKIKFRQVLLRGDWQRRDNGPLLAYRSEDKQPVALLPASQKSYVIVDPAAGTRQNVTASVAETLEGMAYMFYRPFPSRVLTSMDLMKVALDGLQSDLTMLLLMGILGSLLGMLTPIMTGMLFDKVIPASDRTQLLQIGLVLLVCALAEAIFGVIKAIAMLRIEGKADANLQSAVWERLLSLPVTFFRTYTAGDLAMRSMGVNTIRHVLGGVTIQSLLASVFSVGYFGLLFYYNSRLAVIAALISLANVAIVTGLGYLYISYLRPLNDIEGRISGLILQLITGISKLRMTGTEDRAFGLWAKQFGEQRKLSFKAGIVQNVQETVNAVLPVLASMIIFYVVCQRLMTPEVNAEFTTGQFLAFLSAYGTFQSTLLQMSSALMAVLSIVPLYTRLQPILQTKPEVDEIKIKPTDLTGDIEIAHVNFRYHPDSPLVLKDLSMQINSGEFIAIVGGSGSGKSTLMRLLLGFETPESGSIYYDRQDLSSLDITEVRRQMGVVLQNSQIIGGSILENIAGASNVPLENVWEAARMAGCEADIREMPMGMHTVLPQGGGSLSGGQRQRIVIARAIIKKPRILFFDEATSALDNQTQAIVSVSIEQLKATRIVIAHRLSTIINADRIYVLDQGKIVQTGTYQELIKQDGLFAELAKRQMA